MAQENVPCETRVPTFPQALPWNGLDRFALTPLRFGSFRMAPSSERYRQYAAECLRIAQTTHDQAQKVQLLEMAEAWKQLAEEIIKRETR